MNNTEMHSRRVFESTAVSANALINRGVPPAAIIAGLIGVIAAIGSDAAGPAETARALRLAAADIEKIGLDALQ